LKSVNSQAYAAQRHITQECNVNSISLGLIHKQFLMWCKDRVACSGNHCVVSSDGPIDCHEGTITDDYRNQLK